MNGCGPVTFTAFSEASQHSRRHPGRGEDIDDYDLTHVIRTTYVSATLQARFGRTGSIAIGMFDMAGDFAP